MFEAAQSKSFRLAPSAPADGSEPLLPLTNEIPSKDCHRNQRTSLQHNHERLEAGPKAAQVEMGEKRRRVTLRRLMKRCVDEDYPVSGGLVSNGS